MVQVQDLPVECGRCGCDAKIGEPMQNPVLVVPVQKSSQQTKVTECHRNGRSVVS